MHVQRRTRVKQLRDLLTQRSGIQKAISTHVRSIINLIIATKCTTIIIKYHRPNSFIFAFCFCCLSLYTTGRVFNAKGPDFYDFPQKKSECKVEDSWYCSRNRAIQVSGVQERFFSSDTKRHFWHVNFILAENPHCVVRFAVVMRLTTNFIVFFSLFQDALYLGGFIHRSQSCTRRGRHMGGI